MNPKMRHVHGRIADSGRVLLPTTGHMVTWSPATFPRPLSIHVVVPAARAPTASRCDGASATLAPVTTTSTAARTKGTGQEQGRTRQMKDKKSVPLRALQVRHSRSFTASHGHSKLLLESFVLPMSCISQAHSFQPHASGTIPVGLWLVA